MFKTTKEYLKSKTAINKKTDCWLWLGHIHKDGYGYVSFNNKNSRTHRVMFELSVGEIPKGFVLDHLCKNRSCINPKHLEAVTQKINAERAGWATRTHCKHGHEYTKENTSYSKRDNARVCKTCKRIDASLRRAKNERS